MNYYKTSMFTYNEYVKEYKNNNIKKGSKIDYGISLPKILEIFDTKTTCLDYKEESYFNQINKLKSDVYFFESNNKNEYRLDFIPILESNTNLKDIRLHNKVFISISFSTKDATTLNYDNPTNLGEQYDVLSKIEFLIKEYQRKNDMTNKIFMFGEPEERKFKMYQYFIKICLPDKKFIKDFTSSFSGTNIGFYFL